MAPNFGRKPVADPYARITLSLPPALKAWVAEQADEAGSSISSYVVELLVRERGAGKRGTGRTD